MNSVKTTTVRLKKDLWIFLKMVAAENNQTLNKIVNEQLEVFKKNHKKKLHRKV